MTKLPGSNVEARNTKKMLGKTFSLHHQCLKPNQSLCYSGQSLLRVV